MSLFLAVPATAQSLKFTGDFGGDCVGSNGGSSGVAIDPRSRNVVVSLPDISVVCILDPNGNQLGVLTQADGVTPYPFLTPLGVAIDPDTGQIVVADAGDGEDANTGSVTVFEANGVVSATQLTLLGSDTGFDTPTGVAIDAGLTGTRGQIVVTDPSLVTDIPAIRAFNAINPGDATATRNGGAPGSEQILDNSVDAPIGVAIDGSGDVWYSDVDQFAIIELNSGLTNPAFLTLPGENAPIDLPLPTSLSFDPVSGGLAVATFTGPETPVVVFFSAPGAPFVVGVSGTVRRPAGVTSAFRGALRPHPQARHAAIHAGRATPRLHARFAAAQHRRTAHPDCGCGGGSLVAAVPVLFTDGADYISFNLTEGSTLGGQAFSEDPENFPPLFVVTFTGLNTVLVGDDGGEPLQRFVLTSPVPTLGSIAALGFAFLLGMAALMRLRRAS